jgi:glycosyltransferase involved in cell wall biosynthesis
MKKKVIRTATIPVSLSGLLKGQLKFLTQHFNVIGVSSYDKEILQLLEEREQISTKPIEIQRQIAIFKDVKSLVQLYLYFKKEKPFIVHSITPKAGLLSMVAAKLAGVPHRLHTFTGLIFPTKTGFSQKLLITMDRILCACATKIYPEGNGVKNDLINYKITSKPLKIIANGNVNGIDMNYFSPSLYDAAFKANLRKELGIAPEDFVFVFIGRLVTDKGINELAQVFSKLSVSHANIKLLLVGGFEAELDPVAPETLDIINTNENIVSTGWVTDVRPYLAISNTLAFPSYREGFPNVVLQAGAMGVSSIVTNINGCNEIIIPGKNGSIIPVKDEDALYNAMQDIALSKVQFNAKDCRALIASRYQSQLVWDGVLEEYLQLS